MDALHAALDVQRRTRGLTWSAFVREISPASERTGRRLSLSTIKDVGTRAVAEVPAFCRCYAGSIEGPRVSCPAISQVDEASALLPDAPANMVLRFDTKKMYAAVDARRAERDMTWAQVAKETQRRELTRLSKGGRTGGRPTELNTIPRRNAPTVSVKPRSSARPAS